MAGMNGREPQHQIVAADWQLPIVFMTSQLDDDAWA
jgi:hypothetical protein